MNKKIVTSLFCALISTGGLMAQEETPKKTPMKVEMKEVNGQSELLITKEVNGMPTQERFTGETADKKFAEIESEMNGEGKQVEVEVTETEAGKKVRVVTRDNGIETVEEFLGDAAEAKLKELEEAEHADKRAKDFQLTPKKPKVREKSAD